ncbi:MAG TPA: hypothetical protein PKN08_06870 [Opitutaceae bacterium]|nr:hypothetical protein [Opitutaceae bacterium]HQL21987.1 hypothetical protein [Opitutaceae bacterium]
MNDPKAAVEFSWSNPKALYEIAGTESGFHRLSEAALKASQDGNAQFVDDLGTSVHFVRVEEIRPLSKMKKGFFSAVIGLSPLLFLFLWIPLAAIGVYTVSTWIFSK